MGIARQTIRAGHWLGPALLAIGLGCITALWLEPPDDRSPFVWWILTNASAFQRILPLIGLGVLLALVDLRASIAGFLLFAVGIALGYALVDAIVLALERLPSGPARHHFLTAPVLSIAVGVALAVPARFRILIFPFAVLLAGVPLAVAIWMTNPQFHDPIMAGAGIAFAFWIVAAVCLTVRTFRQPWFDVAGRILGSWLITIGLLYGGASLTPPRRLVSPPGQFQGPRPSPNGLTGPGPDMSIRDPGRPRREPLPEGLDPSRQP